MKEHMTMSWLLARSMQPANECIHKKPSTTDLYNYNTVGLHNCKFTAFEPCLFISFQARTHDVHCDTFLWCRGTIEASGMLAAQFINARTQCDGHKIKVVVE